MDWTPSNLVPKVELNLVARILKKRKLGYSENMKRG